ncbi:hypothetical protein [Bradyrhizobium sp. S3.14.4]
MSASLTFDFDALLNCLGGDPSFSVNYSDNTVRAVRQRLETFRDLPLFQGTPTDLSALLQPFRVSVLMLGRAQDDLKNVVVSVLLRRILRQRRDASFAQKRLDLQPELSAEETQELKATISSNIPRTWVLLDEAHVLAGSDRGSIARDAFIKYAKDRKKLRTLTRARHPAAERARQQTDLPGRDADRSPAHGAEGRGGGAGKFAVAAAVRSTGRWREGGGGRVAPITDAGHRDVLVRKRSNASARLRRRRPTARLGARGVRSLIPLEGRALAGLDEFMLRPGHLSAICRIATTDGGSAFRFERAVTSKFCELVPVQDELKPAFARYLRVKGLSPVEANRKGGPDKETEYRYPALRVIDPGKAGETVASDDGVVMGQWQDVSLADPDVPSKVGAISFGGKRGSKTGLSHLFDWGGFLGLFNDAGALTNFGQLIGKFFDVIGTPNANPYVFGQERLIFGFLIVREDFDMFATLVELLALETDPLRKQSAMRLYVRAVTLLSERAEASRDLSQGRRQDLFSLWREVKPKREGDDQIASTAWHRIAARLENLVDLGLLRKEPSAAASRTCSSTSPIRCNNKPLRRYRSSSRCRSE